MKIGRKQSLSYLLLISVLYLCTTSCSSYKKIPYLQTEHDDDRYIELSSMYKESIVRFQPDDVLSIVVNVVGEPAVVYDYNLPLQPAATGDLNSDVSLGGGGVQTYMVNKQGQIDFPVLGLIKVAGYTQGELEDYLKKSLRKFLKVDPIVAVRLMNFRITITGEVGSPGQYSIVKDNVNIIEALALAGDMTIQGKRDGVILYRKNENGNLNKITLDISDANIVASPYFYLQQGDLVYVTPSKLKVQSTVIGGYTNLIFTVTSFIFSVATTIIVLTK